MIKQSPYVPRQMNGPVINAYAEALDDQFSDAVTIADYLHGLSIATANETELENIGLIVGYPRPLVPVGFNQENLLILGTIPIETDVTNGLSSINSEMGGILSSTQQSESNYMGLNIYRQFLDKIAILKHNGITLASINEIAKLINTDYTITWDANGDIQLHYTNSIGYKNIWILTQLFYRIATEPQVIITSG
jgi:hypothetical protein